MQNHRYTEPQVTPASGLEKKPILTEAVEQAKITGANLATKASETVVEVKDEARKQLENQKGEVVRQISGVNEALRQTAQSLDNPSLGEHLDKLANQVERAADRLEQAELEDIVVAAEDFSRSQPMMFLTGSFLAGLMLARFMRATSPTPRPGPENKMTLPIENQSEVTPNDYLVGR